MAVLAGSVFSWSVQAMALSQAFVNTCDWVLTTTPSPPTVTAEAINNAILAKWRVDMIPVLPVQYVVSQYVVVEITGRAATAMPLVFTPILGETSVKPGVAADDTGDLVGNVDATFVAGTIQKKTAFAGRRNKGSARIGPMLEENVTNNALIEPYKTSLQLAGEFFSDPIPIDANHTITACIFSRRRYFGSPGKPADAGLVTPFQGSNLIVVTKLNPFVGSQVSRKQRGGG